MAKAFTKKKKNAADSVKYLVPILFFVLIVAIVLIGLQNMTVSSNEENLKVMEQSIRRAAVQCYAIEGQYPTSLEYLNENYGLLLDTDKYVYHYRAVGSNMMPDITVFERG
ncbi:hypothetical protein LJC56_08050 [Christensenellaceae bacterium OttesenSCG-928-K19]|nr:hypothetical protein [Christensenellaceae bacterium OttesenSCG-928-K19]